MSANIGPAPQPLQFSPRTAMSTTRTPSEQALRITRKQEIILDVFRAAAGPLTPQEVWESARHNIPRLGIATVYRAVKMFLDAGEVVRVEIENEPPRYEHSSKPHHHHFYCRSCRRIFEVKKCLHNLGSIVPDGFSMEDHSITIYGRCAECGPASAR